VEEHQPQGLHVVDPVGQGPLHRQLATNILVAAGPAGDRDRERRGEGGLALFPTAVLVRTSRSLESCSAGLGCRYATLVTAFEGGEALLDLLYEGIKPIISMLSGDGLPTNRLKLISNLVIDTPVVLCSEGGQCSSG
jgi:hypothetical protein